MYNFFFKIIFPLGSNDYKELVLILFLTLISAFLEILGIGLVIPILNIFVGNDIEKYIKNIYYLKDKSTQDILILTIVCFGLLYLIKFFTLRFLIFKQFYFRHQLFVNISKKLFKKYLYENYLFHIQNNSSKLIRNISSEANLFSMGVIFPLITLFTEIIIFISICVLLLIYDFQTSIITISFISFFGFIILKRTNQKLKLWGQKRQHHSSETLKQLQQGFGSVREVIVNGLQEMFLNKYNYHNSENARVGRNRDTTAAMPRLILELIGISTILILILFQISFEKTISEIFVVVGVFLYAALRLLPNISKIVQSIQSIKYYHAVVDLIFNELSEIKENDKKKDTESINFKNILFENVNFSYPENKEKTLENLNIKINKGDKIAIFGKTGSGKSTLINLFCGLINHNSGKIIINSDIEIKDIIDDWRISIGYVPQTVSIMDESILFNITLEEDLNKVDLNKVSDLLKLIDLYNYVYSKPQNIFELAGENGIKLSGGQCQRLGIARALYRNPSIIILDEATSSLDENTENLILEQLFKNISNKTILSISHRKNSLKYCNRIFEVKKNTVIEINK